MRTVYRHKGDEFKNLGQVEHERYKPTKKTMVLLSFGIALLIVILGSLIAYVLFFAPVGGGNTVYTVQITSGASVSKIASILEENGIIRSKTIFKFFVDFNDMSAKLRAGTYDLRKSMTMEEIMLTLSRGDGTGLVTKFTIVEGTTIDDIIAQFVDDRILVKSDEFSELCEVGDNYYDYAFIADLKDNSSASTDIKYMLEGYLFPDTYEIYTGSTADTIIKKMLNRFKNIFNDVYLARAKELNMSINDVVVLASMIEREGKTADFKKVSAVFHNRIKKGLPMQSCATVQYILGTRKLYLTTEDTSIKSGYNTYLNKGLPIGPICNPGKNAIEAALYPDESYLKDGYLYFCTGDPATGELVFAKTYNQHLANQEKYKPLWIAYDEKNK